jgi:hypothetical protein
MQNYCSGKIRWVKLSALEQQLDRERAERLQAELRLR